MTTETIDFAYVTRLGEEEVHVDVVSAAAETNGALTVLNRDGWTTYAPGCWEKLVYKVLRPQDIASKAPHVSNLDDDAALFLLRSKIKK